MKLPKLTERTSCYLEDIIIRIVNRLHDSTNYIIELLTYELTFVLIFDCYYFLPMCITNK